LGLALRGELLAFVARFEGGLLLGVFFNFTEANGRTLCRCCYG